MYTQKLDLYTFQLFVHFPPFNLILCYNANLAQSVIQFNVKYGSNRTSRSFLKFNTIETLSVCDE